jgi:DNA-binding transcriptional MerR regulator
MPEETKAAAQGKGSDDVYTLTEVAEKTGISMPTLQRYKKNYQSRIPSVGKGRRQRYPKEALPVFEQIKEENIQRRGRPPKKEGAKRAGRPPKAQKAAKSPAGKKEGLLTLTAVSEATSISYPTLVRYVKLYGDRIPSEGKGRSRRYHPEAIEVFKQLRSESPRGRRKKSEKAATKPRRAKAAATAGSGGGEGGDLAQRVASLERAQGSLEREIRELIKQLKKPLKVTMNR